MAEPLISITTMRIKEGKVDTLKRYSRELLNIFETREPQLIAFNVFINEDGTEMTSIQMHPNTASMDFHMEVLGQVMPEMMDKFGDFTELFEINRIEYYGTPSESALQMDRSLVESGATLILKPLHIDGFSRSTAT
jgi:hypothetical protein